MARDSQSSDSEDDTVADSTLPAKSVSSPSSRTRQSPRRATSTRSSVQEGVYSSDESTTKVAAEDEEYNDSESDEGSPGMKGRADEQASSTVAGHTCPHCHKEFTSAGGLNYHTKSFVCRPNLRPGGPVKKGRQKVTGSRKKKSKYPLIRGPVQKRKCPKCERVFTSVGGLEYHLESRVCEKAKQDKNSEQTVFGTLNKGDKFVVHPFGVVEVVCDNRATSNFKMVPESLRTLNAEWKSRKTKIDGKIETMARNASIESLARRSILSKIYEQKGEVDQQAVFFGKDPRSIDPEKDYPDIELPPEVPVNPAAPPESFPDRIVECISIPDKRQRFRTDDDLHLFTVDEDADVTGGYEIKLYLRRSVLTETYDEGGEVFSCALCGNMFASRPGITYHKNASACLKKGSTSKLKAAKQLASVGRRAADRAKKLEKELKKMRRNANTTPAPQRQPEKTSEADSDQQEPTDPVKEQRKAATLKTREEEKNMHPEQVLVKLRKELSLELGKAAGPMYSQVYEHLGYRKPQKTKKKPKAKKRKREASKAKEAPIDGSETVAEAQPTEPSTQAPRNPTIDVEVLADEVLSGRYPSMKRYTGDERERRCYMCKKEDGPLLPCSFCRRNNHLFCLQSRFNVKTPEPTDDFMCNVCIQTIMARRNRAEKRKTGKPDDGADDESASIKENEKLKKQRLLQEIVTGHEGASLLAQGIRVSDMIEMVRDARTRLEQSLEAAKINRLRSVSIVASEELGDDDS